MPQIGIGKVLMKAYQHSFTSQQCSATHCITPKITSYGWVQMDHPPYTPDLAPSDFTSSYTWNSTSPAIILTIRRICKSPCRHHFAHFYEDFYEDSIQKLMLCLTSASIIVETTHKMCLISFAYNPNGSCFLNIPSPTSCSFKLVLFSNNQYLRLLSSHTITNIHYPCFQQLFPYIFNHHTFKSPHI